VEGKLSTAFQVPPSFWRSISSEASGFFGSRGIPSTTKNTSCEFLAMHTGIVVITVIAIFYRLLIKEPDKTVSNYPNLNNIDSLYIWYKLAFFISWKPQGKIKILCFDVPSILQEAITSCVTSSDFQTSAQGPLDINNIIIEETVALFDKSVWSWRDVVRDLEKVRLYHSSTRDRPTLIKFLEPTDNRQSTSRSELRENARVSAAHNSLVRNPLHRARNAEIYVPLLRLHPLYHSTRQFSIRESKSRARTTN